MREFLGAFFFDKELILAHTTSALHVFRVINRTTCNYLAGSHPRREPKEKKNFSHHKTRSSVEPEMDTREKAFAEVQDHHDGHKHDFIAHIKSIISRCWRWSFGACLTNLFFPIGKDFVCFLSASMGKYFNPSPRLGNVKEECKYLRDMMRFLWRLKLRCFLALVKFHCDCPIFSQRRSDDRREKRFSKSRCH